MFSFDAGKEQYRFFLSRRPDHSKKIQRIKEVSLQEALLNIQYFRNLFRRNYKVEMHGISSQHLFTSTVSFPAFFTTYKI